MVVLLSQSLWNERRFLLISTIGSLLISTLFALLLPKRFESTARLITPGIIDSSALFLSLLQSRTVQDRLIERFDLRKVYWDRNWEDARIDLEKHSQISADRKNGIITIREWDGNPDRVAGLVQGRIDELNQLVIRLDATSAHRERVVLENRLVRVRQDLESAQKELSKYAGDNLLGDMGGQEQVMIKALGEKLGKLIVEQGEPEGQDSSFPDEGTQDSATLPNMEAGDSVMIKAATDVQRKLIADQADLESLRESYTAANTRVRATQAEVNQLQRELAKLVGKSNPPNPAKQDARPLLPSLRQLPSIGTGYADLYRAVAINEAVFDTLTQEDELAKVAEMRNTTGVKILDPPGVPENRSWPLRRWFIFLSTVSSFSLAVAWIFGTACWQQRPEDAQKLFAVEVFQSIGAYFQLGRKKRLSIRFGGNGNNPTMPKHLGSRF
jgi:capsule polysaccharide export protein KpsE/RkpR